MDRKKAVRFLALFALVISVTACGQRAAGNVEEQAAAGEEAGAMRRHGLARRSSLLSLRIYWTTRLPTEE